MGLHMNPFISRRRRAALYGQGSTVLQSGSLIRPDTAGVCGLAERQHGGPCGGWPDGRCQQQIKLHPGTGTGTE